MALRLLLAASSLIARTDALNWAVLAAGSKTYQNYRHQADLCHAYRLLLSKGFHPERIVTLAYDDAAGHADNPFPGKLFNAPDPDGRGVDVYAGCVIDYRGESVTGPNFLAVLLGAETTGGNGRVLAAAPDDHVFVFYVDHGAAGNIRFPDGSVVDASQFQAALVRMRRERRYGKMVIYLEACHSGSMLDGLPGDLGVYGVTAVGPSVSSLGTYCGAEAVVGGVNLGTCLGDLFAVFWMKAVDEDRSDRTMQSLFSDVFDDVASYAALHYGDEENQQYGDMDIAQLTLAEFFYPDRSAGQLGAPIHLRFTCPREAVSNCLGEGEDVAYSPHEAQPLRGQEVEREPMHFLAVGLQPARTCYGVTCCRAPPSRRARARRLQERGPLRREQRGPAAYAAAAHYARRAHALEA